MNHSGTSLLEAMLYSLLLSCMALLLFEYFNTMCTYGRIFRFQRRAFFDLQSALALLQRDIRSAYSQQLFWKELPQKNSLMFCICDDTSHQEPQKAVEWYLKNKKLLRKTMHYDHKTKKWQGGKATLITQPLEIFSWKSTKMKDSFLSIHYTLKTAHFSCERIAFLRSRVIKPSHV